MPLMKRKGKSGAHPHNAHTSQTHTPSPRSGSFNRGKKAVSPQVKASLSADAAASSPCPVDALCGGCQHVAVPYADQLAAKDASIASLFGDLVKSYALGQCDVLRPIIRMEHPYHYRNKVMSPFAPGKKIARSSGKAAGRQGAPGKDVRGGKRAKLDREVLCGMYAARSHKLVPTDTCLIENEEAKRIISAIRDLMIRFGIPPYKEDTGAGFMRHAVVRVGQATGEILVTLVTNGAEFPQARAFCRELVARRPRITTVVQNVNERKTNVVLGQRERVLYGPGFILDELCGLSFRISSQSFYQVNAVQTEVLYRSALDLARLSGEETVIDAYCGTGTIGLVAARSGAARVIGVESVGSAVRDARQNARHNGIDDAVFVTADAAELMGAIADARTLAHAADSAALSKALEAIDRTGGIDPSQTVLMMDPPRSGSTPQFIDAACAFGPKRVVYISCGPDTQKRDVELFVKAGYRIEAVQPVDMFPHTDHVECIVSLVKAGDAR